MKVNTNMGERMKQREMKKRKAEKKIIRDGISSEPMHTCPMMFLSRLKPIELNGRKKKRV
jgi:hypothetical protein